MKNGTIDSYVYKSCSCPGRIYIAWGPWYFENFRKMFLPNIGKEQKKVLPFERGPSGTVPYGKSASGYFITFIKRLDVGLR